MIDIDKHLTRRKPMTQHDLILNHLRSGGSLTVAQALNQLGIYALSQRIGDLRRMGHRIKDDWAESHGKRFKRYFLEVTMPSEAQIKRLYAIAHGRGWTHGGVKRLLEVNYKIKTSKDLTLEQYDEVCTFLEKSTAADVATMKRDPNTPDLFK